ncbi:MAG: response regulator, partial [bacterium]
MESRGQTLQNTLTTRKILIVDDQADMRAFLSEELEEEGYEITVGKNGLDALAEISFNSFDVVITDWKLPLRDGLQVLRTAREICRQTPVILITAFGGTKIRKKVEKTGASYLQKPFS